MRKKIQKVTAVFMAFTLVFALTPSAAYATTNLAVGQGDFSTETATLNKKAKSEDTEALAALGQDYGMN